MIVLEFKAYGKSNQLAAVDEAIRTAQFIRNSCIRLWMDVKGTTKNDLQKYCAVLAKQFPFANELNSMARQASADRAWSAISKFYDNCNKAVPGKKVSQASKNTVVLSSTKHQDGNLPKIESQSLLLTKKVLAD